MGILLGVSRAGTVLVVVRSVLGDRWARRLHALGDIVDPVRYASLSSHVALIGLGRVVVFSHIRRLRWREGDISWGGRKKIGRAGIYTVKGAQPT